MDVEGGWGECTGRGIEGGVQEEGGGAGGEGVPHPYPGSGPAPSDGTAGQANTGGGGGGMGYAPEGGEGGAGGSGIVIVKEAATPFSVAPGIWTLNDVAKYEAADEWPT